MQRQTRRGVAVSRQLASRCVTSTERLDVGPERDALIRQGLSLGVAYMPYKASGHDVLTWLMQPRVQGYVPHPFMRDFWRHVDVTTPATAP